MKARQLVLVSFGVCLIVVGSMIWRDRLTYSPVVKLKSQLGEQLKDIDSDVPTDLTLACDIFKDDESWVLFVLEANQLYDSTIRTYFETANQERLGLWIEYDPPLIRLGLGLGLDSPASNTELPIRFVRKSERFIATIAVTRFGTYLVTGGGRSRNDWPEIAGVRWSCSNVRVGGDKNPLSEGRLCEGCSVHLRYASGVNYEALARILDSISNTRRFQLHRWLGNAMVIGGLLTIVFSDVVWSRKRRLNRG